MQNYSVPALTNANCTQAITFEEKCEALHSKLYQLPPTIDFTQSPDADCPHPDNIPYVPVTKEDVQEALFSCSASAGSAPGLSQIPYCVIQRAWQSASEYITALMQKCLAIGYHPKQWRCAITITL